MISANAISPEKREASSTLACFARSGWRLRSVEERVSGEIEVATYTDWSAFLSEGGAADCGLVAAEPRSPELFGWIPEWEQRHPGTPLVLLAPSHPSVLRWLGGLPVTEIAPFSVSGRRLDAVIQEARLSQTLERAATLAESAGDLTSPLREALSLALRSDPPVHSVGRLARAVGAHPSTLHRQLRAATGPDAALTLKGVLEWVIVLRAAGRARAVGWEEAARGLQVNDRTLRRVVRRRLGVPPGRVSAMHLECIREAFRAELDVLLAGRGDATD